MGIKMKVNYRLGEQADLAAITNMVQSVINHMRKKNIDQWDEKYPDKEILLQDINSQELFVGEIAGEIAVLFVLNQETDPEYSNGDWTDPGRPFYVIHRLCVNPAFQNDGIGRSTMKWIEDVVSAKGIQAIRLDTFCENPIAIRLYESLGYQKVGYVHWRKGKFVLIEKLL